MAVAVQVTVVGAGAGGTDVSVVVGSKLFRQAVAHPDGGSQVLLEDPLTGLVVERRTVEDPATLHDMLNA